jgi:3-methyladenine DNA glycosylase AlkD
MPDACAASGSRGARAADLARPSDVRTTIAWLKRRGTKRNRDGMARYAIVSDRAFGVSVGDLRGLAKRLGRDHDLALALWDTGWYEARMLSAFVDEPARVTPAQMDRWCRDFDNWAICDTLCFHLFDKTPHAWRKVAAWSRRREEFVKRAAFALLASFALHDKKAPDEPFARCLPLIERAAGDNRNFVKKGVSWALRGVGRRSSDLHTAAVALARRLAASSEPAARWVGKDALKELTSPAVLRRLAARASLRRSRS